ncbi:putative E3 ubiquitin-protein ligase DTX2 [Oculina patagonica]
MASSSQPSGVVVWEWEERSKLWIPYEAAVAQFLEDSYSRCKQRASRNSTVSLGKCCSSLHCYEVDLVSMEQMNVGTGMIRKVQRSVYPSNSLPGQGIRWEWYGDVTWMAYDIPTSEIIEKESSSSSNVLDLSNTPVGIPNVIQFSHMWQTNKHTGFQRKVRRLSGQSYPLATSPLNATRGSPSKGASASTAINGRMVSSHTKPLKTTVTKKGTKSASTAISTKKLKKEHSQGATAVDPISEFCDDLETAPDEDCAICFEKLCNISSFDEESEKSEEAQPSSIKQLNQCKHAFHASCLQAMYDSGAKDGSLQCPTCKAIHGIKLGNQPTNGRMDVQHLHRSLPGHPDCGMITIVYDFRGGVQGPEHPNPGSRYSARGFPRTCYLPDNQKGKKVLELLKKAWQRRLIFTIGTSSTTGEEGTVVWNEIHHKTEAFSNHMGHGFPDPNYLDNVLAELAAQGVEDDS